LSILEDETASAENKAFALRGIQGKKEAILNNMQLMAELKNAELEQMATRFGSYPINGLDALKKAVDRAASHAAQRAVTLRLTAPSLLSLVYASPTELDEVFNTVLKALIDDSFEGSEMTIDVEEQSKQVRIRFRNHGIGIAYLDDHHSEQNISPEMDGTLKLDKAINYVKRWNGQVDRDHQIGMGSAITITLNRFL